MNVRKWGDEEDFLKKLLGCSVKRVIIESRTTILKMHDDDPDIIVDGFDTIGNTKTAVSMFFEWLNGLKDKG